MNYFEFNYDAYSTDLGNFRSLKGRAYCLKTFLQKIFLLPLVVFFKALMTGFRLIAFAIGTVTFIASLGSSNKAQEVFSQRASSLAKDLVNWLSFPFIVGTGLFRLFLGATLTPAIYFQ